MILYVEDNAQNMRLVRKMLKVGGFEMIGAEDGHKGLDMAKEHMPDLILMDINLPDIDGIEVTKRLKEDPTFVNTPIIALTANAMYGDKERFLDAGCDDYLSKPVSKIELLQMVEKHLAMIAANDDDEKQEEDSVADTDETAEVKSTAKSA